MVGVTKGANYFEFGLRVSLVVPAVSP